jgi:hypothetical protein
MAIEPFAGKNCNKCHLFKAEFHKDSSKKDGYCTICADCKRLNAKSWTKENAERNRNSSRLWYAANKSCPRVRQRMSDASKKWAKDNSDRRTANEAKRRSRKLNATPPWLTGDHFAHIQRTYKLCRVISEETGQKYHVDHIVPLQGKNVCGLHVPWNLRVIPAKLNLEKSNKHDYLPIEYPD